MSTTFTLCFLVFFAVAHCGPVISRSKNDEVTCEKEGNIRNPDNCALYYTCIMNTDGSFNIYEMKCPWGLFYKEEKDMCMNPVDVEECGGGDDPEPEFICSKEGYTRDPASSDCTTFYACELLPNGNWKHTEMHCPDGLAFDEVTVQCLRPEDVEGCEADDVSALSRNTKTDVTCKKEGNIRNPDDCGTYYTCKQKEDGTFITYKMSCPVNLAYNEETDQCLDPKDVKGCEDYNPEPQPQPEPEDEPQTDVTCEKEGNIRNPDDCGTYYTCKQKEDGTFITYKMSCPVNLAYNEETDQCLDPKDVKGCEDYNPEPQPEPEDEPQTEVTCEQEGNIKNPDDCGTYYTCKQQTDGTFITYEMSCPVNLAYNEETDQCLDPKDVKGCEDYKPEPQPDPQPQPEPEDESQTEVTCEEEGNIKNPDDCGTYYTCKQETDGTFITYKMSCPVNLAYNEETDQCMDPKDVKGCEDYKPEPQPEIV